MVSFLSFLSSFISVMAVTAGIILFGWMVGNAIEFMIRQTVRDEIREVDERRRRIQAEIEGK
jgi:hypothetical protein